MKEESNIIFWYKNSCRKRGGGAYHHVSLVEGKQAPSINRAMRGQQDCRHLGTESLAAGSILWLLFRNGKGVAQRERLSQSSIQGRPAPEAGMGRLRTSTAPPEAPRPHTTIPDSPKKRFQHCVGWSKTAGRFQGVSMQFSGLQSSCEVKEMVVRKGGYTPNTPMPRCPSR